MRSTIAFLLLGTASLLILEGCGKVQANPADEAPPAAKIVPFADASLFSVEHPEQFPLAAATQHPTTSELVVTGTVTPDVSRNVPVVSLASGRVNAIHARLGDTVQKGQLLMTVRSDDVSGGYSNYRMAVADEVLARTQYERAKDLYEHGAIALNDLQVAQDTEDKAKIAVETNAEHLRLLGNDPDKPAGMVDVFAPTSGVLTDQQVTAGSLVQAYNTPYPFTISDLSSTWVVCDVYENDLANVRLGDTAEIRLNAYPERMFKGRVSNIGSVLDPNIRTAKVRMEVQNPGIMRLGMFVKATFHGQTREMHTIVPASAVLHMHDRDFVFVPAPDKKFRRLEVVGGDLLSDNVNLQEIKSGIGPGQQVVTNALVLDHVLGQ
ncbi:Efflux transporter, RND family, MFP subunit [Candidatus Sulfotelmatomonas gaucii]|uniref:Efflux transporter, RND family, MFP subunit n=1 Tax=Candidatus Sulfuritelmatomonas gaucii TaxID=2043161 RepID=A0A2N9M705_9BACT|nr:Efflux transporter, RND family, MFP subunit [Candidatus Sulfotelmatomonas gaucii]